MSILTSQAECINSHSEPLSLSEFAHYNGYNPPVDFRETWELDPAPACGTAKKLFRHRRDIGRYKLVTLFCGRWSCPACGPKLAQEWATHVEQKLREAASAGQNLYLILAPVTAWPAVQKELNRAGARYFKFAMGGSLKIIATRPATAKGSVAVQLQSGQAVNIAQKLCRTAPTGGQGSRRITASRAWSLRRPKSSGQWLEVGTTAASWKEIEAAAAALDGSVAVRDKGTLKERADINFPWSHRAAHWIRQCEAAFLAGLGLSLPLNLGEVLVFRAPA